MGAKSQQQAYSSAQERYAELGVDTDKAVKTLATVPISLHCWQGDDVGGFEEPETWAERRHYGDGQLSGQSAQRRRTTAGFGQSLQPHPRYAQTQPSCDLFGGR